ncbi:heat shock 70 kDa protein 12A-like isoform X4 [Dreissena polymorpha]|nr:heat shock 70 kDa protein 12A-like isoform X3 [Dreissena polymorpha]XP_052241816.1 heat shock 70 kDa protein 12A-like isoform X4 [Dreissena polymorpha]
MRRFLYIDMASALPVSVQATKDRLQVAAIDFGTTYSGYAFSFRDEFLKNPLKIFTNQWKSQGGSTNLLSMKTPSCVLFSPEGNFHSFGYNAEEKYMKLAMDDQHTRWFYFKHFKMLLYENKNLTRTTKLTDDKGLKMPAHKVFSACIRYLKDHLLEMHATTGEGLKLGEMHWVLTVPAIWDDSAKQFMREAAVEAGIESEYLSLALEPEAAALYCRYLPMEMVVSSAGKASIESFAPGKRYLVLDAGGGTIDITVHETLPDGTVKEVYKANGGPWGGTTVDKAFVSFLEEVTGPEVMKIFKTTYKGAFLDLMREFEVKKKTMSPNEDAEAKTVFRMPIAIHETYRTVHGTDFRMSMLLQQDIKDNVTFTGDKMRVRPAQIQALFQNTIDHIVNHLTDIFKRPEVQGANRILMVGGFSESKMLQNALKRSFPSKQMVSPEEASLAVLKGAVLFGHNPTAIVARMSRFTYGTDIWPIFDPTIHMISKLKIVDGEQRCADYFDKHIEVDTEVCAGMTFEEHTYFPLYTQQKCP